MTIKTTIAETSDSKRQTFVIAWPASNRTEDVSRAVMEAVSARLGGLPTVVVAVPAESEMASFGISGLELEVARQGLDGRRWNLEDL